MYRQKWEALHPAGMLNEMIHFNSLIERQKRVGVERGPPAGQRDLGAEMRGWEDG